MYLVFYLAIGNLVQDYLKVKKFWIDTLCWNNFYWNIKLWQSEHILVVIVIPISVVSIALNYIIWWSRSYDPTSTLKLKEKYSRLESKFWCIKIHNNMTLPGIVTWIYIFGQIFISYCKFPKFLMARPLIRPSYCFDQFFL